MYKKKLNSNYPHIIYQFLVVKTNEHLIDEMKTLASEIGVNELRIKTAQFYNFKNGNLRTIVFSFNSSQGNN